MLEWALRKLFNMPKTRHLNIQKLMQVRDSFYYCPQCHSSNYYEKDGFRRTYRHFDCGFVGDDTGKRIKICNGPPLSLPLESALPSDFEIDQPPINYASPEIIQSIRTLTPEEKQQMNYGLKQWEQED